MPSPFPGMDPFLESPALWPDVHHELISEIRAALTPLLRPRYVCRVELRVYISNEEIEEAFLKLLRVESQELVTLTEILSPTNKIRGSRGRASFMAKRHEVMNTEVHWVEIDLLRDGTPSVTDPPLPPGDYRILISRGDDRTRTRYWPVNLREALPIIPIPLRGRDPETPLDLGVVFRSVYDRAGYDASVDYSQEPVPALRSDDLRWAKELLKGQLEK